jgi:citrate synthase
MGPRATTEQPSASATTSTKNGATHPAELHVGDAVLTLPVEEGSEGERAIDVSALLKNAGVTTLDYGYANTATTRSAITFLDGENGILRYRGYPIEQLAEHATFVEVAYLLIYGELPTAAQLETWAASITRHTMLHEDLKRFFDAFPREAHPMAILASAVAALSAFYHGSEDPNNPEHVEISTVRLLAKLPTIAAFGYKRSIGQPYVYPVNALDYESNFLNMMFAVPAEPYDVDPDVAAALRTLLILHADHEQNCSTATVRLVGSARSNLYVSIAAGIAALWGPLHGGANQEVLEMLAGIAADGGDVDRAVARAKDKNHPFRLMGFGHRVYRNFDPRATIIKRAADTVIDKLGGDDELLEIALRLEEVALRDEYFVERKLYPNVDFYSGLIYRALGFPVSMFPALFAIGRLPGWIAQWREMINDPQTRIGRPRQLYVGPSKRDYMPLRERG